MTGKNGIKRSIVAQADTVSYEWTTQSLRQQWPSGQIYIAQWTIHDRVLFQWPLKVTWEVMWSCITIVPLKNECYENCCCKASYELKFKKIGEIWKELDQTQRMQPTGTSSNQPFRNYSSLKITCLKIKCKIRSVFLFLGICKVWYLDFNWPPFINGWR
jgi:hypothetical protein